MMMRKLIGLLLLAPGLVLAGEIALTFDDAPTGDSTLMTGEVRTEKLIHALQQAGVEDVLFFCNTVRADEAGRARLQQYVDAGYHLANHSHSHQSAGEMAVSNYLKDVDHAHQQLVGFSGFLPFHRFPYLNPGKDAEAIQQLQTGLKFLGYQSGYVTVDNFDFYINHLLNQAAERGDKVDMAAASELYVDVLWQAIGFYDALAVKYLGRSPRHVLLLHENDAAALFIPALVQKIRQQGWKIVSPQQAYQDPIATNLPTGIYLKQGRVAALAHDRGATADELRHPLENTATLDELFARRVLHQDQP